jgi:hypothetical protein
MFCNLQHSKEPTEYGEITIANIAKVRPFFKRITTEQTTLHRRPGLVLRAAIDVSNAHRFLRSQ